MLSPNKPDLIVLWFHLINWVTTPYCLSILDELVLVVMGGMIPDFPKNIPLDDVEVIDIRGDGLDCQKQPPKLPYQLGNHLSTVMMGKVWLWFHVLTYTMMNSYDSGKRTFFTAKFVSKILNVKFLNIENYYSWICLVWTRPYFVFPGAQKSAKRHLCLSDLKNSNWTKKFHLTLWVPGVFFTRGSLKCLPFLNQWSNCLDSSWLFLNWWILQGV